MKINFTEPLVEGGPFCLSLAAFGSRRFRMVLVMSSSSSSRGRGLFPPSEGTARSFSRAVLIKYTVSIPRSLDSSNVSGTSCWHSVLYKGTIYLLRSTSFSWYKRRRSTMLISVLFSSCRAAQSLTSTNSHLWESLRISTQDSSGASYNVYFLRKKNM